MLILVIVDELDISPPLEQVFDERGDTPCLGGYAGVRGIIPLVIGHAHLNDS